MLTRALWAQGSASWQHKLSSPKPGQISNEKSGFFDCDLFVFAWLGYPEEKLETNLHHPAFDEERAQKQLGVLPDAHWKDLLDWVWCLGTGKRVVSVENSEIHLK